jgi:hypothetical protein
MHARALRPEIYKISPRFKRYKYKFWDSFLKLSCLLADNAMAAKPQCNLLRGFCKYLKYTEIKDMSSRDCIKINIKFPFSGYEPLCMSLHPAHICAIWHKYRRDLGMS